MSCESLLKNMSETAESGEKTQISGFIQIQKANLPIKDFCSNVSCCVTERVL